MGVVKFVVVIIIVLLYSAIFSWVKIFVVLQIMCEPYKFSCIIFETTKSIKKIYPRKYRVIQYISVNLDTLMTQPFAICRKVVLFWRIYRVYKYTKVLIIIILIPL